MKKTATFTILLFGLIAFIFQPSTHNQLYAQFTITEPVLNELLGSTIEATYYSYNQDNAAALSIINQTGEDQTWDFSAYAIEDSILGTGTLDFLSEYTGKPGANIDHFKQAAFMIEVNIEGSFEVEGNTEEGTFTNYSYNAINENGFLDFGTVSTNSFFEGVITGCNVPEIPVYPLPLTFNDTTPIIWNYTRNFTTDANCNVNNEVTEYSVEAEVDGYGTILIGNNSIPVLRISETQTNNQSGIIFTSITARFINSQGNEVASVSIAEDPFLEGYTADSGEIQVVLSETVSVSSEIESDLPQSVKLDQNYPNPFNPTTQITYQLDNPSEVTLSIYSITGQKVGTLINGEFKQAGEYSVSFNASNLASGIYIYRLRAGDQMFTRMMTLMK